MDFNVVLDRSERIGEGLCKTSIRNFNTFIQRAMVVDIPLVGLTFTWTNFRVKTAWAKLDRFLLSLEFISWFPNVVQKGFRRSVSNHNAIGIGTSKVDWGSSPFHFFNWWLEEKDLMLEAIKGWKEGCAIRSNDLLFQAKVKATKLAMNKWLAVNSKRPSSLGLLEDKLEDINKKAEKEGWSEDLKTDRISIVLELWRGIRREEQSWRQMSRVKWLKEGDKNSMFFHFITNDKGHRNFISDISFNGVVHTEPQDIRRGIFDFFKKHYEKSSWPRPTIDGLDLKRLEDVESRNMEEEFSMEEIWEAVKDCEGNKALGPDGLNFNFIKSNWEVIKDDVMHFFADFHIDGSLIMVLNNTFVALIPKIPKPVTMGDFRPSSLV